LAKPTGFWTHALMPADASVIHHAMLAPEKLAGVVARIGEGPTAWSIELGDSMWKQIMTDIPELGVDGVAQEVRRGCEAAALGVVAALAEDREFALTMAQEVLAGPTEMVSRGVGIEHMLRSINVAHSHASDRVLTAVERLVPPADRFAETKRVSALLFAIVDQLAAGMAREFGKVQAAWLASSLAARMEMVNELLRGLPVPLERAGRVLNYDLTRHHTAVIVWADDVATLARGELEKTAFDVLAESEHSATLILPVGGRRVWAWGSRVRTGERPISPLPRRSNPDVRVAIGITAPGLNGFRRSHEQALDAARFGMLSSSGRLLFDFADIDLEAMLSARIDVARDFVRRELGPLAAPGEPATTVRATLKCYLDVERSLSLAAERLHVARNTVAYRVQRGEQLRGRPIEVRRMQLQAALSLAEELGDVVLSEDRDTP
jgi:DNA-binding PucR family transcriptional regulator